jgi:hypothetical protein
VHKHAIITSSVPISRMAMSGRRMAPAVIIASAALDGVTDVAALATRTTV